MGSKLKLSSMQSSVVLLAFLLAAVECSYVAQQRQPVCRQVPREVCTDIQVPQTNFVTERQRSAVPTTRQECSIQQEQQCQTITDRQCNTLLEQQCDTGYDRQCSTTFEKECHTEFDTKQECATTTEEQCDTVPDTSCRDIIKTVSD